MMRKQSPLCWRRLSSFLERRNCHWILTLPIFFGSQPKEMCLCQVWKGYSGTYSNLTRWLLERCTWFLQATCLYANVLTRTGNVLLSPSAFRENPQSIFQDLVGTFWFAQFVFKFLASTVFPIEQFPPVTAPNERTAPCLVHKSKSPASCRSAGD